ncbi:MAG: class A beta-lactamase-related serine hydrolase [Chloroflexi bacterium]|nr:class A beta-lactamase-related serine hydrolase [Chloroflexota bacterium]
MGSDAHDLLRNRLLDIFRTSPAHYALYLYAPSCFSEPLTMNSDDPFYAASIIKLPIMLAAFELGHRGFLNFDERLTLSTSDIVGGSGALQLLTSGISLSIWDLLRFMICVSDNTATNMLINRLGMEQINAILEGWGLRITRVHHLLQVGREGMAQRNTLTVGEIGALLTRVAQGSIVSRWACEQAVAILKRQQFNDEIPALLPTKRPDVVGALPVLEVAHKTGWIPGTRHDAAIVYTPTLSYVLCIFCDQIADDAATRLVMRQVSRVVFDSIMAACEG